jgi:P-type conjugative transfer protein TrbJ
MRETSLTPPFPAATPPPPSQRRTRTRGRKWAWWTFVLAAALQGAGAPRQAAAIIPVTDAAHIAVNASWHYTHYVQLAWQIYQQYQQLVGQAQQIRAQLLALRKLDVPAWRQIAGELADLDALARSGRALGYALPDAGWQFRATFPGWQSWTDPGALPQQTERALDTMRAGLAAASRQGRELAAGEQLLAGIRGQMATTHGHQEALEQLATLAAFSAQEQLLARQALATQANLQAVASGYWLNREAQARATFAVLATESARAAEVNGSPGWTFAPAGWWLY